MLVDGRCGDVGLVHRDVLHRSAVRTVRGRAHDGRSPWRRAVVGLCVALLAGSMSVASAVLFVYVIYWRTPAPEPAAWSCPAEWHVLPGDTLWSISRTCWPNRDPREGVDAIQAANPGLHPGRLRVGQVLRLPVNVEVAGGGGKQ